MRVFIYLLAFSLCLKPAPLWANQNLMPEVFSERPEAKLLVDASSLGKERAIDRNNPNFFRASLAAAAVAGLTGCVADRIIRENRNYDPIPNSYVAERVSQQGLIADISLHSVRFITRTQDGTVAEVTSGRSFNDFARDRSFEAKARELGLEISRQQTSLASGFQVTPRFGVSTDVDGNIDVGGGFEVSLPPQLGSGRLSIIVGSSPMRDAVRSALSIVQSTRQLIGGAGGHVTELNNIANRQAESAFRQAQYRQYGEARNLYFNVLRTIKITQLKEEQIRLMDEEIAFYKETGYPTYGYSAYEVKSIEQIQLEKKRELILYQSEQRQKIERFRALMNLHPDIQLEFKLQDLDTDIFERYELEGQGTDGQKLRQIVLTNLGIRDARDRLRAAETELRLDELGAVIPDATIAASMADRALFMTMTDQLSSSRMMADPGEFAPIVNFPELRRFWQQMERARIIPSNEDPKIIKELALRQARVAFLETFRYLLEDIRVKWIDLDGKTRLFLLDSGRLANAKERLQLIRTARGERGDMNMRDDFAVRREIYDLEIQKINSWVAYFEAYENIVDYFQELLRNATPNVEDNFAREGQEHLEALQRARSINMEHRCIFCDTIGEGKYEMPPSQGRSLGIRNKSNVVSPDFLKRLSLFAEKLPFGEKDSPAIIFLEENAISKDAGYLSRFRKKTAKLEIFARAASLGEKKEKFKRLSPLGRVHFYNDRIPLYAAMNQVLQNMGEVPVITADNPDFFRKLSGKSRIIRVTHENGFPPELTMELVFRIGVSQGRWEQLVGEERSLIGYDPKRQLFYLLPIQRLIQDLFNKIMQDSVYAVFA